MTEYEALKEEIITTAAGYTDDIKALTTRLMTIIAERCWLKDEGKELPFSIELVSGGEYEIYTRLREAGWRPVVEIKKEA